MIKLRGFLMTAASAAAMCGLIALFSPTPVGGAKIFDRSPECPE
jgi:hypothetical protein